MKSKKSNVKKVLYIILLVILGIIFVSSLTFGAIGAFTTTVKEDIEVWFASSLKTNVSLLKDSIKWLIISSVLLILTLSFKDFKKKFID